LKSKGFFFFNMTFIAAALRPQCILCRVCLVIDMGKRFGHTNSSFSLARADKVLCMMNVCRGELSRMTTKGFIEVRMMLRASLETVAMP
jgi:hypothetical protein